MGEAGRDALRVGCTSWTSGCDRTVKLESHGATVSSDAGLFPYRDLDDAVQLTEADQDRGEGGASRTLRHVSTGRGRGVASAVPGDP